MRLLDISTHVVIVVEFLPENIFVAKLLVVVQSGYIDFTWGQFCPGETDAPAGYNTVSSAVCSQIFQ